MGVGSQLPRLPAPSLLAATTGVERSYEPLPTPIPGAAALRGSWPRRDLVRPKAVPGLLPSSALFSRVHHCDQHSGVRNSTQATQQAFVPAHLLPRLGRGCTGTDASRARRLEGSGEASAVEPDLEGPCSLRKTRAA